MNKEKKIPGHILSLFIILLSISGICLLMYKAQFRFNLHQPIEYVMMGSMPVEVVAAQICALWTKS